MEQECLVLLVHGVQRLPPNWPHTIALRKTAQGFVGFDCDRPKGVPQNESRTGGAAEMVAWVLQRMQNIDELTFTAWPHRVTKRGREEHGMPVRSRDRDLATRARAAWWAAKRAARVQMGPSGKHIMQ